VAGHVEFVADLRCDACRKNQPAPKLGGVAPPTLFRMKYVEFVPGKPRLTVSKQVRAGVRDEGPTGFGRLTQTFVPRDVTTSSRSRWKVLPDPLPERVDTKCPRCGSVRTLVVRRDFGRAVDLAREAKQDGALRSVNLSI
jgi:hypothetical protein